MKTFKKHHFGEWETDRSKLGGFARVSTQEGDAWTCCTRCKVSVKMGRKGGMKFWVGGKWTSKRPACEVPDSSDDPEPEKYGLGYMQGRGAA